MDFLVRAYTDFASAFQAFSLVLIASSLLFVLTSFDPSLYDLLSASRKTPWGVVTSIFVHYNLLHITGNIVLLFAFLLLFTELHKNVLSSQKHKGSFFF